MKGKRPQHCGANTAFRAYPIVIRGKPDSSNWSPDHPEAFLVVRSRILHYRIRYTPNRTFRVALADYDCATTHLQSASPMIARIPFVTPSVLSTLPL